MKSVKSLTGKITLITSGLPGVTGEALQGCTECMELGMGSAWIEGSFASVLKRLPHSPYAVCV